MLAITDHDRYYWKYEYDVVSKYLIPLIESWGIKPASIKVLDVGCGDGGGIAALHDSGMICKGFDAEPRRIELAGLMMNGRSVTLSVGDINRNPIPFFGEKFDLVVLHDVFEHLEHKQAVLQTLKSYLGPKGKLLLTFPPYYSAYGGHQQLLRSRFARLPFVHLLPFMVSSVYPSLKNEDQGFVAEIQKLATMKMGIKKFEKLLTEASLSIEAKESYLISPNHIRFGFKPKASNFIARTPFLGELLISGVVYLLKCGDKDNRL
jgi:SAM-dependent methyltransferase